MYGLMRGWEPEQRNQGVLSSSPTPALSFIVVAAQGQFFLITQGRAGSGFWVDAESCREQLSSQTLMGKRC